MTEPATTNERPDAEKWPSVEAAQAFVIPSYTWMLARVEAADSRLHTLTAFVATVTLAIPAASRAINSGLSFSSLWFVLGAVLAMIAVAIGVVARISGVVQIASPTLLYATTLHLTEWEFQRNALFRAGEAFDHNRKLVQDKSDAVMAMGVCFGLELVALLLWIARG